MHPDPRFHITNEAILYAIVMRVGVVHLFVATVDGPMVTHVPVIVTDAGDLRFHIARRNRITPHLDGAQALASAMSANGYISPDWYADGHNQVPTWNYTAVEIDGVLHPLGRAELVEQIDALSAQQEEKLTPKAPWTMAKVDAGPRDAMLGALSAFELRVTAIRGTHKMSQNKSAADRDGVIAALEARGDHALASAMPRG